MPVLVRAWDYVSVNLWPVWMRQMHLDLSYAQHLKENPASKPYIFFCEHKSGHNLICEFQWKWQKWHLIMACDVHLLAES